MPAMGLEVFAARRLRCIFVPNSDIVMAGGV
jgi:hypothetical protein